MLYEWRVYEVVPGRMPDLHRRFAEVTTRLFQKHGIEVVGFWEAVVGQSNTLYYMLRFRDAQHREEAWASFLADPEWQAARAASEANGPLVARIHNSLLRPTAYSPSV